MSALLDCVKEPLRIQIAPDARLETQRPRPFRLDYGTVDAGWEAGARSKQGRLPASNTNAAAPKKRRALKKVRRNPNNGLVTSD